MKRKAAGAAGVGVAAMVAAVIGLSGSSPKTTFGVDFGWGGPSVSAMKAAGAKFGASYLSYDSSKNWQLGQVRAYHAAGIATVNVWETGAARATQGFGAGQSDARAAVQQAAALGEPANRPIYYAIDCDCAGWQVASYFDGVNSVEGVARTGAYGGFYPIRSLFDSHRIKYGWQTYAWSGGNWDSRAQLQQYSNGHLVGGRDTDYDRGTRVDYGQYGGPVFVPNQPPKPKPDPYAIYPKQQFALAHGIKASEYYTAKTWDARGCRNPVKRDVCKYSSYHLSLLRDRLYWVAHHGTRRPSWGVAHRGVRYAGLTRRLNAR